MNYSELTIEISKYIIGGTIGTLATSWYKDIKAKKDQQKRLFIRMITAKSYIKIPQSLINDMNIIPILFRGQKTLLEKYHYYYDSLCLPSDQVNLDLQQGLYLDLLREIGNKVGYRHLDNKTLISRYIPNQSLIDHQDSLELQRQLLEYLKNANEVHKGTNPSNSLQG